ncbi:MAG TPA: glutamine--fructose-6-phosphate transaminase (isomerizing) [Pirellulales bacterium]|jgi:glucosamine--fructose-6-phosphate aminotransferase (isomerizing)|nr:glutamine--fructose-6-phosphate transaminase (isomerizing) [Pirellulales bacterium]
MCGIVGYIGGQSAQNFLVQGLRRLEYRGYDSAGVATITPDGHFAVAKAAGRIDRLHELLVRRPAAGTVGIGHTRWATHGAATDENAHPHIGGNDLVAIAHNGVIENYRPLKQALETQGYRFRSATDSEVIAHLLASCLESEQAAAGNHRDSDSGELTAEQAMLVRAVRATLAKLHGTYGLAVLFRQYPGVLIGARLGSPLVVGVNAHEHFLASDASPLVGYTDQIVYLADHDVAVLTPDSLHVLDRDSAEVRPTVQALKLQATDVDRGGYEHFMLKEIFEQPETLRNTMRGRLKLDDATAHFGGLNLSPQQLRSVDRFLLTGCGTSWHSALVGEYVIEEMARVPVEVEYASELRYRNPPLDNHTLVFAITQSGETADTLAALREMKRQGHPTLAISNVVGSSIAKESDGGLYLHAGPEIGVASTKAFTAQCLALTMLALYFGRLRHLNHAQGMRIIEQLQELPGKVEQALETDAAVRRIAAKYYQCNNFLYLGRQFNFPTALEGALKLKEISYIHAEGYPAAEMKHGPIALVDENTPSVFLMPRDSVFDKVMSNVEEIKARGGPVIAVTCDGGSRVAEIADDVIQIPAVEEYLQPIVSAIPVQLLAYHIAILRGCDVDKPRNLAKSVTVE